MDGLVVDGEWYLVKTATKWHVAQFDGDDGFLWTSGGGYIKTDQLEKLIPLSLAISAPRMLGVLEEINKYVIMVQERQKGGE